MKVFFREHPLRLEWIAQKISVEIMADNGWVVFLLWQIKTKTCCIGKRYQNSWIFFSKLIIRKIVLSAIFYLYFSKLLTEVINLEKYRIHSIYSSMSEYVVNYAVNLLVLQKLYSFVNHCFHLWNLETHFSCRVEYTILNFASRGNFWRFTVVLHTTFYFLQFHLNLKNPETEPRKLSCPHDQEKVKKWLQGSGQGLLKWIHECYSGQSGAHRPQQLCVWTAEGSTATQAEFLESIQVLNRMIVTAAITEWADIYLPSISIRKIWLRMIVNNRSAEKDSIWKNSRTPLRESILLQEPGSRHISHHGESAVLDTRSYSQKSSSKRQDLKDCGSVFDLYSVHFNVY